MTQTFWESITEPVQRPPNSVEDLDYPVPSTKLALPFAEICPRPQTLSTRARRGALTMRLYAKRRGTGEAR